MDIPRRFRPTARATEPLAFGQWTYAAATHDGVTARFYLDGVLSSGQPLMGAKPSNTQSLKLGGDGLNQSAPDGGMDEVKIWNVVRSEQQICEDGEGTYDPGLVPSCTF